MSAAGLARLCLWLLPPALGLAYWQSHPFQDRLAAVSQETAGLSVSQRRNIAQAARAVDGLVLAPGEEFSFNGTVGPRTAARGYETAPSYLEGGSYATAGGGICLVSSAIYRAALLAGLDVLERVPHGRTIRTVPPGLDATVWYGGADLKLRNGLGAPVRLRASASGSRLEVAVLGRETTRTPVTLRRLESSTPGAAVIVQLFRRKGAVEELVSRDLYRLSSGPAEKPPGYEPGGEHGRQQVSQHIEPR